MLANCTDKVAGAGSETTNGITGCAVNQSGMPVADAIVKLIPSQYNPGNQTNDTTVITTSTGSDGRYCFREIKQGRYNIITRYKNNELCGKVTDIQIASQDSFIEIDTCQLLSPGAVTIDLSRFSVKTGYCYLPGTDVFSLIDSAGMVNLECVPCGDFDSLMLFSTETQHSKVLRYDVSIFPLQTLPVNNPEFKYVRTIQFNTSSSGASITSTLYNIPVLLRLDENNINFSQVAPSGADLHFASQLNTVIPHEIEYWDESQLRAAVWIRIDTLYANSTTQLISMYWGNDGILENGKSIIPVFDTSCGFQGVWHLNDNSGQTVIEATQNGYDGTSPDTSRPVSASGIIGNCFAFDGIRSYITMTGTASGNISFSQNSRYTVSAWIFIEEPDDKSHVIVSKGNTQYFLWYTSIHLSKALFEFADFRDQSGWDLSVSPIVQGQWVHLAGVRDGSLHKLYVNGECIDTLIDFPLELNRYEQSDLMIGRFAQVMASPNKDEGYCFFKGNIDEVQISNAARSADWIRFTYINQQQNSKSIIFK